jgi:hypothetical protein
VSQVSRLIDHAEQGVRHQQVAVLEAQAKEGDLSKSYELGYKTFKSLNAALNYTLKTIEKDLPKLNTIADKISLMQGVSRGFDYHVLKAITGPQARKYNGGSGEAGIDAVNEVAEHLLKFLTAHCHKMSEEELCSAITIAPSSTEGYGFYRPVDIVKEEFLKVLELNSVVNKSKIEIVNGVLSGADSCIWSWYRPK